MSANSLRLRTIWLPLLVALAFGHGALRADTIYTNFDADDSYAPGAGLIVTNDPVSGASVAVAFTPSANYNLTSIEFADSYLISGDSASITLGIFADNGGLPGSTPLESFSATPGGMFTDSVPVTTVSSILQPLLLAGTQYWVGMNAAPQDLVIWNQNITSTNGFAETDGQGNWSAADPFQPQGVLEVDGALSAIQPSSAVVTGLGDSLVRSRTRRVDPDGRRSPHAGTSPPPLQRDTNCSRASPTINSDPVTNVVIGFARFISAAISSAARTESATWITVPSVVATTSANAEGFNARG